MVLFQNVKRSGTCISFDCQVQLLNSTDNWRLHREHDPFYFLAEEVSMWICAHRHVWCVVRVYTCTHRTTTCRTFWISQAGSTRPGPTIPAAPQTSNALVRWAVFSASCLSFQLISAEVEITGVLPKARLKFPYHVRMDAWHAIRSVSPQVENVSPSLSGVLLQSSQCS